MFSEVNNQNPGDSEQDVENNPEEVISEPEEVQQSNDQKIDEDFPGYPHYPAREDILDPGNQQEEVDLDVENLSRSDLVLNEQTKDTDSIAGSTETGFREEEEDINRSDAKDADITDEDLLILGPKNEDMDLGEDEELLGRGYVPRTGYDLDIPGQTENSNDSLADDDEENDYFSLGGDDMQNLEENDDQNNF